MLRQTANRKAFSLIEAAIVLGVVGLVIGAIWVAAASFSTNRIAKKTATDIGIIANNIMNLMSVSDAASIGNAQLSSNTTQAGKLNTVLFPADWIGSGGFAYAPYGKRGDEITNYAGSPPYFRIHLRGMPKKYCVPLISSVLSQKRNELKTVAVYKVTAPHYVSPTATVSAISATCDLADDPISVVYFEYNYSRVN